MPNRRWILGLVVVATALGSPAVASERLDARINLELAGAAAVDVFNSFAALLEAEPDLDPQLQGQVTIQLNSVSTRTTMNAVCEMLDCKWSIDDGSPRKLVVRMRTQPEAGEKASAGTLDTTVSLSLSDAPVEEVFKSFASIGNWALAMEETTVSVELDDTSIRQALDEVCAKVHCSWELDLAGEATLRISWVD